MVLEAVETRKTFAPRNGADPRCKHCYGIGDGCDKCSTRILTGYRVEFNDGTTVSFTFRTRTYCVRLAPTTRQEYFWSEPRTVPGVVHRALTERQLQDEFGKRFYLEIRCALASL